MSNKTIKSLLAIYCFAVFGTFAVSEEVKSSEKWKKHAIKSYYLSPLDQITITVFDEPDLSTDREKSQRIDASGLVHIPLIGNVELAGLTVRQAEKKIKELFISERYLANPQISVNVKEYYVKKASVLGQVETPSIIKFDEESNEMEISEVIALAGGFNGIAKSNEVRITRINSEGKQEIIEVDVKKIINGNNEKSGNNKNSFMIFPGDIIFVPERIF